ncbi:MAG TPA: magnesium transporter [Candidatus Borkfalkia faecigallinarum]|uniref:Magnesium transporter MgtE n=1 Tax=Candidatus Borkfalkia faecigallinarum TaxID=2838509 RepID=A0A9D2ARN7_9FIRM|nr:magnesium transporter [Candidatus Borkfalkia faecigallinarum]
MKEKIIQLLDENRIEDLHSILDELSAEDLAALLDSMDGEHLPKLFGCLDKELAADVFVLLDSDTQKRVLKDFSDVKLQPVTDEIIDDDVEDLLESMPTEVVHEVLRKATPENRNDKIVEIVDYLEEKKFPLLKPLLAELEPADLAEIFSELDERDIPIVFRLLPKELAAETFVEMGSSQQQLLINSFSDKELKLMLDELFVDDTVDLIEEMPANVVKRILLQADSETRKEINEILKYPKDSAGSLMTTECISLHQTMTVSECFDKIRREAIDKETIYTCYVTDNQRTLLGIVTVKDLLLHNYDETIGTFMETNIISVKTLDDKEEVANLLSKYDLLAVPVVDQENRLVGIVTVDDALDVITEEATEDISYINAVTPSDKPYLETNVFSVYLHRLPWLAILMVGATFSGLILNIYEELLPTVLVACVPMIMGTGGNAGSQASVTVIRGMALDEIRPRNILQVIWKELRVAVLIALSIGIICFAKLQLIDRLIFGYEYTVYYSLAVAVAIAFAVIVAKIVGCCVPILAETIHIDPAVFANPFITTITDVLSLLIFCGVSLGLFHIVS